MTLINVNEGASVSETNKSKDIYSLNLGRITNEWFVKNGISNADDLAKLTRHYLLTHLPVLPDFHIDSIDEWLQERGLSLKDEPNVSVGESEEEALRNANIPDNFKMSPVRDKVEYIDMHKDLFSYDN